MGTAVVDTSVLIGVLESTDLLHDAAVGALREVRTQHDVVVPSIAFAEVLVGAVAAGAEAERIVVDFVRGLGTIAPLDGAMAERAARIRVEHGLPLPDGLILGAAHVLGAAIVLTGDARWRRADRRVRVVAPAQD